MLKKNYKKYLETAWKDTHYRFCLQKAVSTTFLALKFRVIFQFECQADNK